ncbi:hypothetical protein BCR36DRAFT_346415 [Piromyces finnis]|uniref:DH domain-containing protein n=1 Tax=Piromyces finnis TaxID=1754191 RepID=A0A1Y1VGV3_9FUNG|nr:hypothetical protein BCR36DRAFT_346415 [Piromyces finnis]|eukprot:ORX55958.1 hypothetical protein BCR36DRAFT_346415 [Piromyces finnis]
MKKQNINNQSNLISSTLKDDTLVDENMDSAYSQSSSISTLNANTLLTEKDRDNKGNENKDDSEFSQFKYKTVHPLNSDSIITKITDSFNDEKEKLLEKSLSLKSIEETKEFIKGLEKYPQMTSSPIKQEFNSYEVLNKKSNTNIPTTTINNSKGSNINNTNICLSSNSSTEKSSQKSEFENEEISYVIGCDSTSSFIIPFEEESLLSDDMKRQSYCSISSDPNYRLSISSISNIDLNNKRQSIYSNSSNINNNSNNISKVNLPNFSSEILQVSSFTPPMSPTISTKLVSNNNQKGNANPTIVLSESSNSNNSITSFNSQSIDINSKVLYDKSILRPVGSKEIKEEKSLFDKSFIGQVENKDDNVPFDRSFLRQIEGKNTKYVKSIKDEKSLINKTSLNQVDNKEGNFSKNRKYKPKDIKINTKPDISCNDKNNLNEESRGRPINLFSDNIFVRRSRSQGSTISSPIRKEIISPTEIQKVTRRKNRTSDPCTPLLRHNKSTSVISSRSPSNEISTREHINSHSLKSKLNSLKNSENGLRRSSSYSCIQMSSTSTSLPSSTSNNRFPLKSSSSIILNSNLKIESTKLNPLVNSDDETHTPQKVIDNLNKLNVESKKTTMSDIPKIILSMAEFIGVIFVNKSNQLLSYFEERYPKFHTIISILQVITKYIPNAIFKSSEILRQGYVKIMNRIHVLKNFCESNNIPFPDINQFIRLFNILKNQIIEKIMLAKDGQLQLPSNFSAFMAKIYEILSRTPKKSRLALSKNNIKNICISGPVGGHPIGTGKYNQYNHNSKTNETQSSISITLVQNDQNSSDINLYDVKKIKESNESDTEIISFNHKIKSKISSPSSSYDESSIITKSLSNDSTIKEGSYPFFKHRSEKNINTNRYFDDINTTINNRNSYQSSDSLYVSDNSRIFTQNNKHNEMGENFHHHHKISVTSNDSVTEPIIKDNINVNNLIELFEKQMSQTKILNSDFNDNESLKLPSQPPQVNPRTHSLRYSLKQRQQKTDSMVSDDRISISTSDSSEFEKVDFDENLSKKAIVNYSSGHRRSHSQPDDSYLNNQEERENDISLSQEVSSELRHKFTKIQDNRIRSKESIRSQSMIFNKEKFQKSNQNELLMAVKKLKPVSSSTRLSVPTVDIRSINNDVTLVDQEKILGPVVNNISDPISQTKSLTYKRDRIVEELFQTEKTYVKELASIVHLYLDPLDTVPGHFLDMQEYKTLFGNLRDIFDFHNEAFAPRLEKSCFPERNKSIVPPPSVGSFFQLNAPVLANLYGEYYTNSNMANNFLTRIQNSKSNRFSTSLVNNKPKESIFKKENKKRLKKFKTFLQWVCGQPEHTQMSLQGYLLLPVQRLPRYLLLLEQLLKNTRETDKEYRDLNKAKEAIRMVVEQCNERIRHFEERQHVIEIISNIRLCSSNVHSIGGKVIKNSSSSYNKRLLLDTVPAKTKVEFFVKLQNLTKLDELRLIKEGRFQIYKVKQCDSKVTGNKKNKNNRREPTNFSNSPALRAQRIAQRTTGKERKSISENDMRSKEDNEVSMIDSSAFSPSLNSISPMIYNTVMKMSMSPKLRSISSSSTPPSSSNKKRKTRRRSSLESLSPPFIKILQDDKTSINNMNKMNKIIEDDDISKNKKLTLPTTKEDEEINEINQVSKHHSLSTINLKESLSITNDLINPSFAIWEQVYLINNNLVEVLSSTNELVRIMELVKPKVGHLPNSIINPGCQVDIIDENGIQMLTVCDGHTMIYLMGLKEELFEWKEAINKILQ